MEFGARFDLQGEDESPKLTAIMPGPGFKCLLRLQIVK